MARPILRAADRVALWHHAAEDDPWAQQQQDDEDFAVASGAALPSPAEEPPVVFVPKSNKFNGPVTVLKHLLDNEAKVPHPDDYPAAHSHPAVAEFVGSHPYFSKAFLKPKYTEAIKHQLGEQAYDKLLYHLSPEHHEQLTGQPPSPSTVKNIQDTLGKVPGFKQMTEDEFFGPGGPAAPGLGPQAPSSVHPADADEVAQDPGFQQWMHEHHNMGPGHIYNMAQEPGGKMLQDYWDQYHGHKGEDADEVAQIKQQLPPEKAKAPKTFGEMAHDIWPEALPDPAKLDNQSPEDQQYLLKEWGKPGNHPTPEQKAALAEIQKVHFGQPATPAPTKKKPTKTLVTPHYKALLANPLAAQDQHIFATPEFQQWFAAKDKVHQKAFAHDPAAALGYFHQDTTGGNEPSAQGTKSDPNAGPDPGEVYQALMNTFPGLANTVALNIAKMPSADLKKHLQQMGQITAPWEDKWQGLHDQFFGSPHEPEPADLGYGDEAYTDADDIDAIKGQMPDQPVDSDEAYALDPLDVAAVYENWWSGPSNPQPSPQVDASEVPNWAADHWMADTGKEYPAFLAWAQDHGHGGELSSAQQDPSGLTQAWDIQSPGVKQQYYDQSQAVKTHAPGDDQDEINQIKQEQQPPGSVAAPAVLGEIGKIFPTAPDNLAALHPEGVTPEHLKAQLESWLKYLPDTPGYEAYLPKIQALYDQNFGPGAQVHGTPLTDPAYELASDIHKINPHFMLEKLQQSKPEDLQAIVQSQAQAHAGTPTGEAYQKLLDKHFGAGQAQSSLTDQVNAIYPGWVKGGWYAALSPQKQKELAKSWADAQLGGANNLTPEQVSEFKKFYEQNFGGEADPGAPAPYDPDHLKSVLQKEIFGEDLDQNIPQVWLKKSPEKAKVDIQTLAGGHSLSGLPLGSTLQAKWQKVYDTLYGPQQDKDFGGEAPAPYDPTPLLADLKKIWPEAAQFGDLTSTADAATSEEVLQNLISGWKSTPQGPQVQALYDKYFGGAQQPSAEDQGVAQNPVPPAAWVKKHWPHINHDDQSLAQLYEQVQQSGANGLSMVAPIFDNWASDKYGDKERYQGGQNTFGKDFTQAVANAFGLSTAQAWVHSTPAQHASFLNSIVKGGGENAVKAQLLQQEFKDYLGGGAAAPLVLNDHQLHNGLCGGFFNKDPHSGLTASDAGLQPGVSAFFQDHGVTQQMVDATPNTAGAIANSTGGPDGQGWTGLWNIWKTLSPEQKQHYADQEAQGAAQSDASPTSSPAAASVPYNGPQLAKDFYALYKPSHSSPLSTLWGQGFQQGPEQAKAKLEQILDEHNDFTSKAKQAAQAMLDKYFSSPAAAPQPYDSAAAWADWKKIFSTSSSSSKFTTPEQAKAWAEQVMQQKVQQKATSGSALSKKQVQQIQEFLDKHFPQQSGGGLQDFLDKSSPLPSGPAPLTSGQVKQIYDLNDWGYLNEDHSPTGEALDIEDPSDWGTDPLYQQEIFQAIIQQHYDKGHDGTAQQLQDLYNQMYGQTSAGPQAPAGTASPKDLTALQDIIEGAGWITDSSDYKDWVHQLPPGHVKYFLDHPNEADNDFINWVESYNLGAHDAPDYSLKQLPPEYQSAPGQQQGWSDPFAQAQSPQAPPQAPLPQPTMADLQALGLNAPAAATLSNQSPEQFAANIAYVKSIGYPPDTPWGKVLGWVEANQGAPPPGPVAPPPPPPNPPFDWPAFAAEFVAMAPQSQWAKQDSPAGEDPLEKLKSALHGALSGPAEWAVSPKAQMMKAMFQKWFPQQYPAFLAAESSGGTPVHAPSMQPDIDAINEIHENLPPPEPPAPFKSQKAKAAEVKMWAQKKPQSEKGWKNFASWWGSHQLTPKQESALYNTWFGHQPGPATEEQVQHWLAHGGPYPQGPLTGADAQATPEQANAWFQAMFEHMAEPSEGDLGMTEGVPGWATAPWAFGPKATTEWPVFQAWATHHPGIPKNTTIQQKVAIWNGLSPADKKGFAAQYFPTEPTMDTTPVLDALQQAYPESDFSSWKNLPPDYLTQSVQALADSGSTPAIHIVNDLLGGQMAVPEEKPPDTTLAPAPPIAPTMFEALQKLYPDMTGLGASAHVYNNKDDSYYLKYALGDIGKKMESETDPGKKAALAKAVSDFYGPGRTTLAEYMKGVYPAQDWDKILQTKTKKQVMALLKKQLKTETDPEKFALLAAGWQMYMMHPDNFYGVAPTGIKELTQAMGNGVGQPIAQNALKKFHKWKASGGDWWPGSEYHDADNAIAQAQGITPLPYVGWTPPAGPAQQYQPPPEAYAQQPPGQAAYTAPAPAAHSKPVQELLTNATKWDEAAWNPTHFLTEYKKALPDLVKFYADHPQAQSGILRSTHLTREKARAELTHVLTDYPDLMGWQRQRLKDLQDTYFGGGSFSPQDKATLNSGVFQSWFAKAPKGYQDSVKREPGYALDDYQNFLNGGPSYSPVPEGGGKAIRYDFTREHFYPHTDPNSKTKVHYPDGRTIQVDPKKSIDSTTGWPPHAFPPGFTVNPMQSTEEEVVSRPEYPPENAAQQGFVFPPGEEWVSPRKPVELHRGIGLDLDMFMNRIPPVDPFVSLKKSPEYAALLKQHPGQPLKALDALKTAHPELAAQEKEYQKTLYRKWLTDMIKARLGGSEAAPEAVPDLFNTYQEAGGEQVPVPSQWADSSPYGATGVLDFHKWCQDNHVSPEQVYSLAKKWGVDDPGKYGTPPLSEGPWSGPAHGEESWKSDRSFARLVLDLVEATDYRGGQGYAPPGSIGDHWSLNKSTAKQFGKSGTSGNPFAVEVVVDWDGRGEWKDDPHAVYGISTDEQEIPLAPGAPVLVKRVRILKPNMASWNENDWHDLNIEPHWRYATLKPTPMRSLTAMAVPVEDLGSLALLWDIPHPERYGLVYPTAQAEVMPREPRDTPRAVVAAVEVRKKTGILRQGDQYSTQTVLPGQQFVPTNEVSVCPPGHAYDPIHGLCVPYFPAINVPGYGQQCPDGYFYDPIHNVCTLFPPVYPPPGSLG